MIPGVRLFRELSDVREPHDRKVEFISECVYGHDPSVALVGHYRLVPGDRDARNGYLTSRTPTELPDVFRPE
jgi:hypothetical protein